METEATSSTFTPQRRPSRDEGGEIPLATPVCWSAPHAFSAPPPSLKRRCSSLEEKAAWLTEYAPRMPWTTSDDEEDEDAWLTSYRYHVPPCFSPGLVTIHRRLSPRQHREDEVKDDDDDESRRRLEVPHRAPHLPCMPDDAFLDPLLPQGEEAALRPRRLPDALRRLRPRDAQ